MKRRIALTTSILVGLYLILPLIAGAMKIGERTGPRVYPDGYHGAAFRIGYALAGHGKPRISFDHLLYKAPFFYGLKRRLLEESEATALFERIRDNGNARGAALLAERYRKLKARAKQIGGADESQRMSLY